MAIAGSSLEAAYEAAWLEWEESEDAGLWESAASDGLPRAQGSVRLSPDP